MRARPLLRVAATLALAMPLAAAAAAAAPGDPPPAIGRIATPASATVPHSHFTEKTGMRPTKRASRGDARAPLHDHGAIHKQR